MKKTIIFLLLTAVPTLGQETSALSSAPITLNLGQVQVIAAALNIAASSCAQDASGCTIGLNKPAILAKLADAAATITKAQEAAVSVAKAKKP